MTDFGHRGSTLTLVRVYPDFGTVDYNMCMIVHYLLAPWRFEKSINEYVVLAWSSFTFAGRANDDDSMVRVGQTWARAARHFFKDFGVLGPQNPKIFSVPRPLWEGGLIS